MTSRFQGDPKMYIDSSGMYLYFLGGNPVMDSGLENQANISLLTAPGFWGNVLFDSDDEKLGSDFESTASGAITLQSLTDVKQAAERAVSAPVFGKVTAEVTNPVSWRYDVEITYEPPGQDTEEISLSKNGQNWINQAETGGLTSA